MSLVSDIIDETQLDLSIASLPDTVLAPLLADRISAVFPDVEKLKTAISGAMGAALGATGISSALSVYTAAIAVIGAAASALEGRLDDVITDNYKRLERARNLTIQTWVAPGDWSICMPCSGLPVGKVDLYNQVGGWGEQQFLDQYQPGFVWMAERTLRSDILLPTWASPPYTSGFGFRTGEQGTDFPPTSPLTGYLKGAQRFFKGGQPNCKPFPSKYDEDYFGTMPVANAADLAELQGPVEGAFKAFKRLQNKLDEGFYKQAFVPPPDYWYCFSVGTYPYTSWNTAAGDPLTGGSPVILNGTMAAIAAGIHSVSPIHAMVRSSEVDRCYRAWSAAVRLQDLPPEPKAQLAGGITYRDKDGLPFALADKYGGDSGVVQTYTTRLPANKQDPTVPKGLARSYLLNWRVVKNIEESFRSFYRIRRAALYQFSLATKAFRDQAKLSPDPILRAVAEGKPPPRYQPWSASDPLGDLASSSNKLGVSSLAGLAPVDPGSSSGGSVAALVAAGLLSVVVIGGVTYYLRGKPRRSFSAGRAR